MRQAIYGMVRCMLVCWLLAVLSLKGAGNTVPPDTMTDVQDLSCEYLVNPLGLDMPNPRLSWKIVTAEHNWRQSAYQILVSSDPALLEKNIGDRWNSGKISSAQSIQLKYNGSPLRSLMSCYWKVRVWDAQGHVTPWSKPAYWKMGILSQGDWKGRWICSDLKLNNYQRSLRALPDFNMLPQSRVWQMADSIRKHIQTPNASPAVYIRKDFKLQKAVKRATAYVCGLGLHELYVDGRRVGRQYLNPAYTDYEKRVLYNTYDVTGYLTHRENALGVVLGNGWYNLIVPHALRYYAADYIAPPRLLMELLIEYQDGSTEIIASDTTWKYSTDGPIRYNDILSGESYDARKEITGWSRYGYQDHGWKACLSAQAPVGILKAQLLDPVRKIDSFRAVHVEKTEKGYRFDMGRSLCGWVSIKLRGKRGQRVKVSYPGAPSHTLGRYQTCFFTLKGNQTETFEPNFSYNGFRYVEVEGIDYEPALSDVKAYLVATDLKKVGTFSCSNEKFNRLQKILVNTIRNYIVHLPNDPTREKSGWTQDIENGFDVNAYNFNVAATYIKWQHDFDDIIHANGYVPPVVPGRFDGPDINGPWWGGMIIYNVHKIYAYYGDEDIVRESYPYMKKYMGYLNSISRDHIVEWGLGDWMEPFRGGGDDPRPTTTPVALTSTAAYYEDARILARFARILGRREDCQYYTKLSDSIRQSYNKRFFNAKTGQYAAGSEGGQVISLYLGLVPPGQRASVIQRLKELIKARDGHLSTGFVTTPFLLTTLDKVGLRDEAYAMATKNDFPGWFDMIFRRGNSVMMENWKGGLVQMPSLGGPIGYWFFSSLGGISSTAPAFRQIEIKPYFSDQLTWVSASYQSLYGLIAVHWQRQSDRYLMEVNIPANTRAEVYLPTRFPGRVSVDKDPLEEHPDMKITRTTAQGIFISIGSGNYSFVIKRS